MMRTLHLARVIDNNSPASTATWDPLSALRDEATPDEIYEVGQTDETLYQYETKRAGRAYNAIFGPTDAADNFNNNSTGKAKKKQGRVGLDVDNLEQEDRDSASATDSSDPVDHAYLSYNAEPMQEYQSDMDSSGSENDTSEDAGAEEGGMDDNFGEDGDADGQQRAAEIYLNRYKETEDVENLRESSGDAMVETEQILPTGHLEKEGVIIGSISVFVDVHVKEFIVILSDEMIQAFLVDPGRFRAVANKSKCEIEVTRRILNRKIGQYRWLKYLVVAIRGPNYSAIDQCDKMMISLFPPYKSRKPYGFPASVSMFLREDTPDNSELFFNYQRTGPALQKFGEIPLKSPFMKSSLRPLEDTPWKITNVRQQWGVTEPTNVKMETAHDHVYPDRGANYSTPLDHERKWKAAADYAVEMARIEKSERSEAVRIRRRKALPLTRRVDPDED